MTTATRSAPRKYTYGPEVCDWIETNCVLPSGDMAGQPFRLMAWQREWIDDLFATDVRGKLKHRWALLGVPKGNGKSPLVAALALYHLLGDPDEEDPWVVVAAAGDKQADIVFDAAKTICRLSPQLNAITTRYRWEIRPKDGLGKMERVAASKGRLDGKLISFLVMDELHEWQTENWVVLILPPAVVDGASRALLSLSPFLLVCSAPQSHPVSENCRSTSVPAPDPPGDTFVFLAVPSRWLTACPIYLFSLEQLPRHSLARSCESLSLRRCEPRLVEATQLQVSVLRVLLQHCRASQ